MLKRRLDWEERAEEQAEAGMSEQEGSESESEVSSSSESEMDTCAEEVATPTTSRKVKGMILCGRGVNARQRHLMDDICALLPHLKKESKFDTKEGLFGLNELTDLNGCTHTVFLEPKKPQELFIWVAKCPSGPSVRFHVQNIHTLDELHMPGNCMKNTRAILSFDAAFDATPEGLLMKGLLTDIFAVPEGHRKTKPYFDHLFQFSLLDDRIWFRNYQIVPATVDSKDTSTLPSMDGLSLQEIGPRLVLHPVRAFQGSFGGKTVWQNANYTPASVIRSQLKQGIADKHNRRQDASSQAAVRRAEANLPKDELAQIFH